MNVNYSDGITKLLQGHKSFHTHEYGSKRSFMATLVDGQQPKVMVIGCCDSRVDPALLLGVRPGDILVLRSIANLVPRYRPEDLSHLHSGAAIEFAVNSLNVEDIVVLGHSNCVGIQTTLNSLQSNVATELEDVREWLATAEQPCKHALQLARDKSITDHQQIASLAERQSILNSLENLKSYPSIRDALSEDRINLHGWWFDIRTGSLKLSDPDHHAFREFEDEERDFQIG